MSRRYRLPGYMSTNQAADGKTDAVHYPDDLMILPSLETLETHYRVCITYLECNGRCSEKPGSSEGEASTVSLTPYAPPRTSILRSHDRIFRMRRHRYDFQVYLQSFTQKLTWHLQLWFPDLHDDFRVHFRLCCAKTSV